MRLYLILLLLFTASVVQAQLTNSPNSPLKLTPITNSLPSQAGQSMEAQTALGGLHRINLTELKPNEIAQGKFVFSGIAVEAVKKSNPLQLINPLAPADYGSPDDNIVRDPTTHRVGFKLFAIRF